MGALADLAAMKAAVAAPRQRAHFRKTVNSTGSPNLTSLWLSSSPVGSVPSVAEACTNATTGAMQHEDGDSGELRIVSVDAALGPDDRDMYGLFEGGTLLIADRLSHQGGLSGASSSEQTTNLPTAALTRYTTGEGVWITVESYAANTGGTSMTGVASYTNQAGTAGHTTTSTSIRLTSAGQISVLPLAAGDTGARSVESVTLTSAGLSGNFGVTLIRPLMMVPLAPLAVPYVVDSIRGSLMGGMPPVLDGACLAFYLIPSMHTYSGTTTLAGQLNFCES